MGNNEKENISVLVTGNAAGDLAPNFILFAGKSLPNNCAEMAPPDFAFGCSDSGWMTSELFYGYIAYIFEPWLTSKKIKRPILLFIDGHRSHLTLHLSKFCSEHEIVLIALHPNATHIIQPLDVSFFRTLKSNWQKRNKSICDTSGSIGIQKYQFAGILKKTLDSMDCKKLLENGFRKCGLQPFDVNKIDFSKVFDKNRSAIASEAFEIDSGVVEQNTNSQKDFEKFLTIEKIMEFRSNDGPIWKGSVDDRNLFKLWYGLSLPDLGASTNNFNNCDVSFTFFCNTSLLNLFFIVVINIIFNPLFNIEGYSEW